MPSSDRDWVPAVVDGVKRDLDAAARDEMLASLLTRRPDEERRALTREERSDYRAIAGFLIFLSAGVVLVMDVWAPALGGRWEGAVLGSVVLLSITVPLALALLTLRKVFFAVGCWSLCAVSVYGGVAGLIGANPDLAFGIPFGLGLLYVGYRVFRREEPFYGFE